MESSASVGGGFGELTFLYILVIQPAWKYFLDAYEISLKIPIFLRFQGILLMFVYH